ncbi:MAG: hypothetical protein ACOY3P_18640 [Planctomycetota bacterium]
MRTLTTPFARSLITSAALAAMLAPATLLADQGVAPERKSTPIKVLGTWRGKIGDNTLRAVVPNNGVVAKQEEWSKLWKSWRGREERPEVDFDKELVLVVTVDGPNNVMFGPELDKKGNIEVIAASTLMAGPGFGYLILQIPRKGIKSVNGKPLPQAE